MKTTKALAALVFAFPITALADLSGHPNLGPNGTLNLDTGAIATSGGDILFNGSTIVPQGNAKVRNIGVRFDFASLSSDFVVQQAAAATSAPIAADLLTSFDVFVVVTNGGSTAKVWVIGGIQNLPVLGPQINLQYTTFTGLAPGASFVTKILNNSSLVQPGYPNYGIAPSSLFIVRGGSLADPGDPVLQSSASPGLPLTLNGASITVAVNGVTVHPALYYTSPTQLAAVLPAATPVGTGTLTVTYKDKTSAPAKIQVVPNALGINTYNGNLGVATDAATGALLTYTNSGSPGQAITLWATGLGADPADSDTTLASAPHSVNTPLQIFIAGVQATILYQGASTYPGVNQINLTIPQPVLNGCWVPLAAVTGSAVSNVVTLPINNGGGACHDTESGLNGNQIPITGGQTLRTGFVGIIQAPSQGRVTTVADGAFEEYTGLYPASRPSPGGCLIVQTQPTPTITGLDVGTITLTGPSGLDITLGPQLGIKGAFYSMLAADAIPSSGGTFTFKGSGGADVGPFTATVTFAASPLTWTNSSAAASVDKKQGLHVTWTGGTPGSNVYIFGSVYSTSLAVSIGYSCTAPVEAGQFTVPPYILMSLPDGAGSTGMQNAIYSPLVATGLDSATAVGNISVPSVTSTFN